MVKLNGFFWQKQRPRELGHTSCKAKLRENFRAGRERRRPDNLEPVPTDRATKRRVEGGLDEYSPDTEETKSFKRTNRRIEPHVVDLAREQKY